MKKIIFALLMVISTQGYCFPHLEDYTVKKEVTLQSNGIQKVLTFDLNEKNTYIDMYLFTSGNFHGRWGCCYITDYSIWIEGTGKDTKMSIRKKNGKFEKQEEIQFLKDGFISYFDGGYVVTIKESEEKYLCFWAAYTN